MSREEPDNFLARLSRVELRSSPKPTTLLNMAYYRSLILQSILQEPRVYTPLACHKDTHQV